LLVCMAASVWALLALYAQYVRLEHRNLLSQIEERKAAVALPKIEEAIADYEHAMRIVPCNILLHKDLALLAAQGADLAMTQPYGEDIDYYLEKTLNVLSSQLSCAPMDGKAWLEYAIINSHREGFTEHSLNAYKMSQRVTAGEAYLAERRMVFAVQFRPLFDAEAVAAARSDLVTLKRAAIFRMQNIIKAGGLKTEEEVYALF